MMNLTLIILTVNEQEYEVKVGVTDTLAITLREKIGLTGTKTICNESGECGACTVLIDGEPVLSCLTLAIECEGKKILTIEGLANPQRVSCIPSRKPSLTTAGCSAACARRG